MENSIKQKTIYRKRWLMAASFLWIIITSGGLMFQNRLISPRDADLFMAYYQPYPSNLFARGSENVDSLGAAVVALYDNKDYQSVIGLLEQRMIESPNDDIPSKMLLGNSYLAIELLEPFQAAKAIEIFKSLAADKDNIYKETAQWYLALSYIRKGNHLAAKQFLEILAVKRYGKYPKLANELLKKL
jgi:hypothetical protein